MALSPFPTFRRRKSAGRPTINPSHPLARGLVFSAFLNEGGGATFEAVTGQQSSNRTTWITTPLGVGANVSTGTNAPVFSDNTLWHPGTSDVTIAVYADPAASGSALAPLWRKSPAGTTPFWALYANGDVNTNVSSGKFACYLYQNSSNNLLCGTTGSSYVDGKWHQYVGSMTQSVTANCVLYYDGLPAAGTISVTGAPTYSGTDPARIAYDGSSNTGGGVAYAYVWFRALTANEVAWFYADPFAFVAPRRQVGFYRVPTGDSVSGTATSICDVAGTANVTHVVVPRAVTVVADTSAAVNVTHVAVPRAVTAVADTSGVLRGSPFTLKTSVTAVCDAAGHMATPYTVQGHVTSVCDTGATLQRSRNFTGSATAVVKLVAAMSPVDNLVAQVNVCHDASATVVVTHNLTAAIRAVCDTGGTQRVTHGCSAAITSICKTTAVFSDTVTFTTAITAVCDVAATAPPVTHVMVPHAVTAIADASATVVVTRNCIPRAVTAVVDVAATAVRTKVLSAAITSVVDTVAQAHPTFVVRSSVTAVNDAGATILRTRVFGASCTAICDASATLVRQKTPSVAPVTSVVDVAATLARTRVFTGSATAVCTVKTLGQEQDIVFLIGHLTSVCDTAAAAARTAVLLGKLASSVCDTGGTLTVGIPKTEGTWVVSNRPKRWAVSP